MDSKCVQKQVLKLYKTENRAHCKESSRQAHVEKKFLEYEINLIWQRLQETRRIL